ncbi:hypothetical protein ABBQ32_003768 [Trebouxia sp. C0010 RCD-2024]
MCVASSAAKGVLSCACLCSQACTLVSVSRYFVTDGSKFGSDYLLYPGDPLFYHAQFTVQVLDHQATIKPALLVGGTRGSHSARKHLLLASVSTSSNAPHAHVTVEKS